MTTDLERAVAAAKKPDPADEVELLRGALQNIQGDLRWYFACGGAISREDMMGMIRSAQARIDSVRSIVWPEVPDQEQANAKPLEVPDKEQF